MDKIVLISIKPEFSDLIFSGKKMIELRKSKPDAHPGNLIIIYNTQPEMAIVGYCRLKRMIELTPHEIWCEYSSKLGIDRKRFNEYYHGRNKAIGIELIDVKKFEDPISLRDIRKDSPSFSPPQTFKYLTEENLSFLNNKDRNLLIDTMYN